MTVRLKEVNFLSATDQKMVQKSRLWRSTVQMSFLCKCHKNETPLGCEDFSCHPAPVSEPSLQVRVSAFARTGPASLRNLSVHMYPALPLMLFGICCCWHLSLLFFFVSSFLAPVWTGDLGSPCRYFQVRLLVLLKMRLSFMFSIFFVAFGWPQEARAGNAELMQPSSSCSFIHSFLVPHSSSDVFLLAPVCLLDTLSASQLGLTVLPTFRTSYDKDLPSSNVLLLYYLSYLDIASQLGLI